MGINIVLLLLIGLALISEGGLSDHLLFFVHICGGLVLICAGYLIALRRQ